MPQKRSRPCLRAPLEVLFSSLCSAEWALALRTRAERQADGRPLLFGVGLNEFTHMLVQHNLLGEELGLEDADALFMASAAPAKDASGTCGGQLWDIYTPHGLRP